MTNLEAFLSSTDVYYRLAKFGISILIGFVTTKLVLVPLFSRIYGLSDKKDHQVRNIIQVAGLTLTLVIALQAGGFGDLLTIIGTVVAALTVAIGFGMREQVANFVSGVFIHLQILL